MKISEIISRILDSEFGAYPAGRGLGAGMAPVAAPKREVTWSTPDLVGSALPVVGAQH